MLKLIGALLLAGGAGALGCSAAAQLSRRVAVLRALLGALEGMEREIAFRLTPMPELLERAAAESPPPVCTLFARCRTLLDELGERSMAELWREALEQVPLGLDGPGRLALEELKARPLYRRLLDEGLFRRLAIIERAGRERRYQVVELC